MCAPSIIHYTTTASLWNVVFNSVLCFPVFQINSDFILESERESFIEQVREVIEMADEKGGGIKDGFPQVILLFMMVMQVLSTIWRSECDHLIFFSFCS